MSIGNDVMISVKKTIHFVLLKEVKDTEGHVVCIQSLIEGLQVVLCNICAPNTGDWHLFNETNNIFRDMDGWMVK